MQLRLFVTLEKKNFQCFQTEFSNFLTLNERSNFFGEALKITKNFRSHLEHRTVFSLTQKRGKNKNN